MNYLHQFHAGNIADVFKHLVLVGVLDSLRTKNKPFCIIDTHAGSGRYRLQAPGEFEQGIGRLWPARAHWPVWSEYFRILADLNPGALLHYPGSPWIIQTQLREQDRAIFLERNAQEAAALRRHLHGRPGITINEADAWSALTGLLPPRENRGLVFIDPPYEAPDEFERMTEVVQASYKRWRNGLYMLWYPIKSRRPVDALHAAVRRLGGEALAMELLTLPDDVPQRLNGSGVLLINPPWKLDAPWRSSLPALAALLAGPGGSPQTRIINLTAAASPAGS